jgi:uncharacterized membrane protein YccC
MSSKLIAALLLGLTLGLAHAAELLPWEQLGETEQQVLKPYAGRWESFSPEQQQRLQQGARRWQAMNSEERAAVGERCERWQQMPDEQKQRIRERYSEYQSLPPAQQQRIREQMEAFRQMPAEQREQLLQRWQSLSEEERQALRAEAATRQAVEPPGTEEAGEVEPKQEEAATPPGNGNGDRFHDNRMERRGIDTPMRRPR